MCLCFSFSALLACAMLFIYELFTCNIAIIICMSHMCVLCILICVLLLLLMSAKSSTELMFVFNVTRLEIKFLILSYPTQSGFRPHHSCQTALIDIIDKWLQEMNDGNLNLAILLDFKKAFDLVDHDILCLKLAIYGFSESAVGFFRSYLSNRTQQVNICNVNSDKKDVKFGVPQGSILGPLLFVLFINDLPLCIKNCKTDLYADDTTLHKSGKSIENLHDDVQEDLCKVEEWCKMNNMFINTKKTKCLVTGTSQKLSTQSFQPNLVINSEILQNSSCEKLLDVKIDSTLSWKNQID